MEGPTYKTSVITLLCRFFIFYFLFFLFFIFLISCSVEFLSVKQNKIKQRAPINYHIITHAIKVVKIGILRRIMEGR